MICLYCKKGRCVKNGLYKKTIQRYKCLKCDRTFSDVTIENILFEKMKRIVLHLILAGCSNWAISSELRIEEKLVKKWRKVHFRRVKKFLPKNPLLTIRQLTSIYAGIEKSSTKFNFGRHVGVKRW